MSAKRSKLEILSSSLRIRQARKAFQAMSKLERIDLMVQAGSMTQAQAEKAKKKLAETTV